ncbi:hypothetical protein BDF21DRAFT_474189 [Thamnidium elegans]|nr:hypothetical protein BDF21DRAFT_474189 [Thamnidium elegans]
MQRKTEDVKIDVSNRDLKIYKPRTRAYIKQEAEESKETSKCALYSSVKIESPSSEISEYDSNLSTDTKNRHCSICNINFRFRELYLDHELHSHKTKDTPIIDLKTRCCNICSRRFRTFKLYRKHMTNQCNIHIPPIQPKRNLSKIPDTHDLNNYCSSCSYMFKSRNGYNTHLINVHHITSTSHSDIIPNSADQNNYCAACDQTFNGRHSFIEHLTSVHLDKMPELYQGLDCESFSGKDLMYTKSCADCQKVFLSKRLLRIHMNKIHSIKPLEYFPGVDDPNNHCTLSRRTEPVMDFLKKYCNVCDRTYKSLTTYRAHLCDVHGIVLPRPRKEALQTNRDIIPDILDKNDHCASCNRTYSDRRNYLRHLATLHNVKEVKIKQEDTEEKLNIRHVQTN